MSESDSDSRAYRYHQSYWAVGFLAFLAVALRWGVILVTRAHCFPVARHPVKPGDDVEIHGIHLSGTAAMVFWWLFSVFLLAVAGMCAARILVVILRPKTLIVDATGFSAPPRFWSIAAQRVPFAKVIDCYFEYHLRHDVWCPKPAPRHPLRPWSYLNVELTRDVWCLHGFVVQSAGGRFCVDAQMMPSKEFTQCTCELLRATAKITENGELRRAFTPLVEIWDAALDERQPQLARCVPEKVSIEELWRSCETPGHLFLTQDQIDQQKFVGSRAPGPALIPASAPATEGQTVPSIRLHPALTDGCFLLLSGPGGATVWQICLLSPDNHHAVSAAM
ncbi:MAG TPA: hypothetical protein VFA18_23130 [Gemmataceae bacterium]|nr:hypothetical protein [Gemmataceae bacterium]